MDYSDWQSKNNSPSVLSYNSYSSSSTSSVGIGGGSGASMTSVIGGGGTLYAANGNAVATDAGFGGSGNSGRLSYDEITRLVADNNLSGQSNELITCMSWKESSFDPNAQSETSSARGLMGMTKRAAKDVGTNYNSLFDSATNIKAGSSYLSLRISWENGNVTKGLNGYGTGTGYSTKILGCEGCLKNNPQEEKKCLTQIHP